MHTSTSSAQFSADFGLHKSSTSHLLQKHLSVQTLAGREVRPGQSHDALEAARSHIDVPTISINTSPSEDATACTRETASLDSVSFFLTADDVAQTNGSNQDEAPSPQELQLGAQDLPNEDECPGDSESRSVSPLPVTEEHASSVNSVAEEHVGSANSVTEEHAGSVVSVAEADAGSVGSVAEEDAGSVGSVAEEDAGSVGEGSSEAEKDAGSVGSVAEEDTCLRFSGCPLFSSLFNKPSLRCASCSYSKSKDDVDIDTMDQKMPDRNSSPRICAHLQSRDKTGVRGTGQIIDRSMPNNMSQETPLMHAPDYLRCGRVGQGLPSDGRQSVPGAGAVGHTSEVNTRPNQPRVESVTAAEIDGIDSTQQRLGEPLTGTVICIEKVPSGCSEMDSENILSSKKYPVLSGYSIANLTQPPAGRRQPGVSCRTGSHVATAVTTERDLQDTPGAPWSLASSPRPDANFSCKTPTPRTQETQCTGTRTDSEPVKKWADVEKSIRFQSGLISCQNGKCLVSGESLSRLSRNNLQCGPPGTHDAPYYSPVSFYLDSGEPLVGGHKPHLATDRRVSLQLDNRARLANGLVTHAALSNGVSCEEMGERQGVADLPRPPDGCDQNYNAFGKSLSAPHRELPPGSAAPASVYPRCHSDPGAMSRRDQKKHVEQLESNV